MNREKRTYSGKLLDVDFYPVFRTVGECHRENRKQSPLRPSKRNITETKPCGNSAGLLTQISMKKIILCIRRLLRFRHPKAERKQKNLSELPSAGSATAKKRVKKSEACIIGAPGAERAERTAKRAY